MHHPLHFHVFIHLHLTSHLGTLDAPREGHDVELNPKMVLVDSDENRQKRTEKPYFYFRFYIFWWKRERVQKMRVQK
jgi:hypothetical protein